MARYKEYDYTQGKFIPIHLSPESLINPDTKFVQEFVW